jgi:hypothetical protein
MTSRVVLGSSDQSARAERRKSVSESVHGVSGAQTDPVIMVSRQIAAVERATVATRLGILTPT